jgi:uncharacterized protein (DUF302 family)
MRRAHLSQASAGTVAMLPPGGGPAISRSIIEVEHICIVSERSYAEVLVAMERLPKFDERIRDHLRAHAIPLVTKELEALQGPDGLVVFSQATHGAWLDIRSGRRNLIQYVIGNVLVSTQMTERQPAAGLYAPLRVVVYENDSGNATVEYDRPSDLFGQFGDDAVKCVAEDLDEKIYNALIKATTRPPRPL